MSRAGATARLAAAAVIALGAAGCERILGIGEPTLGTDATPAPMSCTDPTTTTTRQFVISALEGPSSYVDGSFDLDGDENPDNRVFSSLQLIAQVEPDLDLQPTIDAQLAAGRVIQLLQAELGKDCATTTVYEGEDRDVPINAADNFSGEESFRVVGIPRGRMLGVHIGGNVLAGDGSGVAELRLPLFPGTVPIDLPLVAARIRYVVTENAMLEGAIGGAIRADLLDGVVIPSFAASLQSVVDRDCSGTAPECCTPNTAGDTVLSTFNADGNCDVSIEEVRGEGLTQSLFSPDLDLYNGGVLAPNVDGIRDAVSIGIPFTAVNAFFLTPTAAAN